MFYADFVLSKKGPLSKVWLAAHWEKKLSKAQIVETNVDDAVDEIMRPTQKLALRTTGHLLLGICRVYSRKTKYLLADTNEAFLKIKLAFRNGALDQPNPVLPTFTIQDIYGEFGDNILPEFDEEELNHAPICQSRLDDITLKEDIPTKFSEYQVGGDLEDDDFGEIAAGVGPEDYQRLLEDCSKIDIEMEMAQNAATTSDSFFGREREPTPFLNDAHVPGNAIFGDDDFATAADDHMDDEDDRNIQGSSGIDMNNHHHIEDMDYENDNMNHNMGAMTPLHGENHYGGDTPLRAETPMSFRPVSPTGSVAQSVIASEPDTVEAFYERQAQRRLQQQQVNVKKRRLDDVKMITGDEMKANMADYSDTLNRLDLAPPTFGELQRKKRGTSEFLHHNPGMIGFSRSKLFIRHYQSNLSLRKDPHQERKNEEIKQLLGLRDFGEDEIQQQQQEMELQVAQEDTPYVDDFEESAITPLDLENFDVFDEPVPEYEDYLDDEPPLHNPLSPFILPNEDEEEVTSPVEKKRKRDDDDKEPEVDEDNRWSKRTHALLQTIGNKLQNGDGDPIELEDMIKKNSTRKAAAAKFYSLLCLTKNQCVKVTQEEPYASILISPGPNIDANMI